MTFSDSDLKRLKEHLMLGGYADERVGFNIQDLIHRLEAAERVVALAPNNLNSVLDGLLTTWRNAAGKDAE